MGNKLVTAFITGAFFAFFLDFFFILGLFLNYIQAQDIDVYYNVLFADHQSYLVFFSLVAVFGYLFIFFPSAKIATIIFALSFALVNLSQIPSIGFSLGQMMFEKPNQVIKEGQYTYIGKTIYEGRSTIWFYEEELKKIIEIQKQDVK
ncbi:hypothetical protein JHD50_07605 [Sulfurimonas sp. MAG313]|nr:hypothetical protein [Sulfurimonas sp. MAG313]MDF1881167.1 hypothetical protein [Sulfurimonas sp. MAG313]